MAADDACQATEAAEFRQKLDAMVTTAVDVKKKYDAAHVWVLAATELLEEEQRMAATIAEEARAAAALIEPPSPTPPPPRYSRCYVGRRLRGRCHHQHPRPGRVTPYFLKKNRIL
jgi:methionyl-tRNA synthetase